MDYIEPEDAPDWIEPNATERIAIWRVDDTNIQGWCAVILFASWDNPFLHEYFPTLGEATLALLNGLRLLSEQRLQKLRDELHLVDGAETLLDEQLFEMGVARTRVEERRESGADSRVFRVVRL